MKTFRLLLLLFVGLSVVSCKSTRPGQQTTYRGPVKPVDLGPNKVQVALILDTSGSMDHVPELGFGLFQ